MPERKPVFDPDRMPQEVNAETSATGGSDTERQHGNRTTSGHGVAVDWHDGVLSSDAPATHQRRMLSTALTTDVRTFHTTLDAGRCMRQLKQCAAGERELMARLREQRAVCSLYLQDELHVAAVINISRKSRCSRSSQPSVLWIDTVPL